METTGPERHSESSEPDLISDPQEVAAAEARNALRQFDVGMEILGRVVKLVGLEKPTDWDSQISQSVIHGEPSFLEAFHEALCTAG